MQEEVRLAARVRRLVLAMLVGSGVVGALTAPALARPIGKVFWTQIEDSDRMTVHQRIYHPAFNPPAQLGSTAAGPFMVGYDVSTSEGAVPDSGSATWPRMHVHADRLGFGFIGVDSRGLEIVPGDAATGGLGSIAPARGRIATVYPELDATGRMSVGVLPWDADSSTVAYLNPTLASLPSVVGGRAVGHLSCFARLSYTTRGPTSQLAALMHPAENSGPVDLGLEGSSPALSPDGLHMVFVQQEPTGLASSLMIASLAPDGTSVASGPRSLITLSSDRRFHHPHWRGDGRALVFSSDAGGGAGGDRWDVYALRVDPAATGALSMEADVGRAIVRVTDGGDCVWPSFSRDGRYVLYSRSSAGGRYQVQMVEIDPATLVPRGSPETVAGSGGADCVWAGWYQDVFAPSLFVELTPADSESPTTVSLASEVLVGSLASRTVRVGLGGRHFTERFDTDFRPAAPALFAVPVRPDTGTVNAGLAVTAGGDYRNTVDEEELPGLKRAGIAAGEYAAIRGFYLNKDVRVLLKVLARDDQYGAAYQTAGADLDTLLRPDRIDPASPAAGYPNYLPPYMPMNDRSRVLGQDPGRPETGEPGVAWWFESEEFELLPGSVNAPDFVFRYGNYEEDATDARPLWFHALARDLWGNTAEVVLPIYVYSTTMKIQKVDASQSLKETVKEASP